jgi:hypothetical protein
MEHWIDDLARAAAGGLSRRTMLRRLAAGLTGGALAALLPTAARAQQTEACRELCGDHLTGDARRRCLADAARGGGLCQACAADPDRLCRPSAQDSPFYGQTLCCAANQTCQITGCHGPVVVTPVDGRPAPVASGFAVGEISGPLNGGVATASANGGAVAISDVNSGGEAGNAIGVGDLQTVGTSAGVSPAAAAGASNQLPPVVVPAVPDCPTGTTACGVAGCCPSGTVCTDRGCVRGA